MHTTKRHIYSILATIILTTSTISGITLITTPTVSAAKVNSNDIKVSQKMAVKKFTNKFNHAKINEITLEAKGNHYQYEIEGFDKQNEYSAIINANTGKISREHSEKLDNDDQPVALNLKKTISRKAANKIAEKEAKSGHGHQWTLENDNDKTIWDVEVVNGHKTTEVKINAINRDVISVEYDD